MEPWEILGIEPTDDLRTVKKAYAKKVKVTRPEEDPAGFQQLNEAYEYIVDGIKSGVPVEAPSVIKADQLEQVVKINKSIPERASLEKTAPEQADNSNTDDGGEAAYEPEQDEHSSADNGAEAAYELASPGEILEKFAELLQFMAENQAQHNDQAWQSDESSLDTHTQQWLAFLRKPEFIDIDYKRQISYSAFYELVEFFKASERHNLPFEVKARLLEIFAWHEHELELCKQFGHDDVDAVLSKLVLVQANQEATYQHTHQQGPPDIQIDPIVFKMLGAIVCLLMAFVLVAAG